MQAKTKRKAVALLATGAAVTATTIATAAPAHAWDFASTDVILYGTTGCEIPTLPITVYGVLNEEYIQVDAFWGVQPQYIATFLYTPPGGGWAWFWVDCNVGPDHGTWVWVEGPSGWPGGNFLFRDL